MAAINGDRARIRPSLTSKFSALILLSIIVCILPASIISREETYLLAGTANAPLMGRKIPLAAVLFALIVAVAVFTMPLGCAFKGFTPWISGFAATLNLSKGGRQSFFRRLFPARPVELLHRCNQNTHWHLLLIIASFLLHRAGKPLSCRASFFLFLPPLVIPAHYPRED
jgi:hypothetical protein